MPEPPGRVDGKLAIQQRFATGFCFDPHHSEVGSAVSSPCAQGSCNSDNARADCRCLISPSEIPSGLRAERLCSSTGTNNGLSSICTLPTLPSNQNPIARRHLEPPSNFSSRRNYVISWVEEITDA